MVRLIDDYGAEIHPSELTKEACNQHFGKPENRAEKGATDSAAAHREEGLGSVVVREDNKYTVYVEGDPEEYHMFVW